MLSTRQRLEVAARILDRIAERRRETGDPQMASSIERRIVDRELEQLAAEWLMFPAGAEALPDAAPEPPVTERPASLFARFFRSR